VEGGICSPVSKLGTAGGGGDGQRMGDGRRMGTAGGGGDGRWRRRRGWATAAAGMAGGWATAARRLRLGALGEVAGWWGGAMGHGGLAAGNPKIVCIYIRVLEPTCHRVWLVCGSGYEFFKSVRKYPLGLELYPRPYPRAQIQTRIHAHRVWYPQVRGIFHTRCHLYSTLDFVSRLLREMIRTIFFIKTKIISRFAECPA
jgi:hypothetical protein